MPLDSLHYVQLRCTPSLYPLELSSTSAATQVGLLLALIEDDSEALIWSYPQPKCSSPPSPTSVATSPSQVPLAIDLSTVSKQLLSLLEVITSLKAQEGPDVFTPGCKSSCPVPSDSLHSLPILASTMSWDEVMSLIHRDGSSLPPVRPCNKANVCDTKMHWSAEELHHIKGCCKFCNCKHLLQVSHNGEWVDSGEFLPSLGSFATIPKSKHSLPLDWTAYECLNAVHMDIAFGDCLLVRGFQYALILVDHAMRYNWTFGLKSLSSKHILGALRLFHAAAGALARYFYSDCDAKLFGTAILEYLIDNQSKVVAAPAKCQSANGLVESNWKTMVHIARAYLTKKQLPRSYWFYAITHAAQMMNAIAGKYKDCLASPFFLVHGVGHDEQTWIPLFLLCYFHHKRTGMRPGPNIWSTLWTASSVATLLGPMR